MLTVAWAVSMGWMAVVNVLIDSDFKLPLVALAAVSDAGLVLAAAAR